MNPDFTIVLRGYDKTQVDAALERANTSLSTVGDSIQRAGAREALGPAPF
ncbi:hypothetical protein Q0Z83_008670 [Actinoplanes sichuanensis]|uniref:DivIVA domain-containing protein n=1 Tax=Actinoplanes sichuanensis TaxID=512349 RepID=A0ABW4AGL3_9ACTN|nr:DivIVA domain-containing protein [Actinoplanes sichuanensis]BEL02676.1 hypothetical protein Q0Z83_008670 [Actinoplanes sichuanensis]